MAYVLGYFAADGSMVRNKFNGHYVEFTSIDRILLEHVLRVVSANHKISKRVRNSKAWKAQYRIQIGCKEWFADLSLLGFSVKKSNVLRFPLVPEEYLSDFVRGYFDGDGCVYYRPVEFGKVPILSTLFTSGSRSFLETLHAHLRKQGVKGGRIAQKNRGFELVLSRHDSVALRRFLYNTSQISCLYLPRKREKIDRAIRALGLEENAGVAQFG